MTPPPLSPAQVMPFKLFMEGLGLEPESPSLFLTPLSLPSSSAAPRPHKLLSFLSDSCYLSPSSSLPPLSPTESLTADDSCSCCSSSSSIDSEADLLEQSLLEQFSTQRLSTSSSASLSPSDQGDEGFAFAQLAPPAIVNSDPCLSLGNSSSPPPPPAISCSQALDFSSEALEGPHLSYFHCEHRQEEEEEELERTSFHHHLNSSAHDVYGTAVLPQDTGVGQETIRLLLPSISSAHTEPGVGPSDPSTGQAATSAAAAAGTTSLDSLGLNLALLDDLPPLDIEPSPSVSGPANTGRSPSWQGPSISAEQHSGQRPGWAVERAAAGLSNKENALLSKENGGLPSIQKSLPAEMTRQGSGHLRPALHSLDNVEPGLCFLRGGKGHRKQVSHSDTPRPLKKRAS